MCCNYFCAIIYVLLFVLICIIIYIFTLSSLKLFPTLFKSIKKFYDAQFDVTFFPDAFEDNCFCGPYSFEVKMASDMDVCTNYPDFAVICSFIENFSEKLKLNLPNIEELQLLLENTENGMKDF